VIRRAAIPTPYRASIARRSSPANSAASAAESQTVTQAKAGPADVSIT